MATILERFKETSVEQFNHSSDAKKANQSSCPVQANLIPAIKDETPQKLSCPYANNAERQDEGESSSNNDGAEKEIEGARCLSPEFLLGSQETIDQKVDTKEGPAEKAESVTCVFCNEAFPNQTALKEHNLTKHYAVGKKWYDCSVCEKRFTHRSSRDIHLRVHTGQRPYECEYCKKRFRVSSHLRDHVRTHTGERPFKCGVCGRGFKQSSDMKKHRKTHFKEMPSTNTEALYTIVMPEHKATLAENPSDIRSPTERQNLKLVIKRERKTTDIKSPIDTKTVSDNPALPEDKPSENPTQKLETSEKPLSACNLDPNANWAASNYYSQHNGVSTIKYTESTAKISPGKEAIKRKLDKRAKNQEKNCHKASSYPSMASGLGQMYTSNHSVNYEQRESAVIEPASQQLQSVVQHYSSNNTTGILQNERAEIDRKQTYTNRMAIQVSGQSEPLSGADEHTYEPQKKVIKTEKLSPNSAEQSTNCHEFPTVIHEQQASISLQPTNVNEQLAYNQEQTMYNHERTPYDHEQPTGIKEQTLLTGDETSYRPDWQAESSQNHVINVVNGYTYNGEVNARTSEVLTSSHVNPSPDIASVDSTAKQEPTSNHIDELALVNISTEIPEDKMEGIEGGNEVPPNEQMSEANVIARKPMIVKLRRDKSGAIKTIRKPIKLKDNEEDVQCSVCGNLFKNTDEFNAHKCGKNGKSFKCTICNKSFARQTLLRQHMVLHQGTKRFRFKCNYCGRAFRHRSHLRDHERIHTGERPFKCSFCPKAFKQSSDHRKHENLHTGTTRYRCEKCSLDFKRCDALKRHATIHTKGEVTLLKCDKCRSLFATADGHLSHACLNKPYRYRCQICPERFTDADDLRRHCYELHGEQSTLSCLKCEFCKMEFNNLEKLDEHLSTHRLKKTHRCRTCDQRFSLLNQLVEHVKIHSTQSKTSTSAYEQSEDYKAEENHAPAKAFSQRKEVPPNVTVTPVSDRPGGRQVYDFIPSKYQPPIHASPVYAEMAIGSWARNYYLPPHPNEHGVSQRKSEPKAISPRHQSTSPRLTPISSRQNSISPRNNPASSQNITDVSENDAMLSRSSTEPHRRNTEVPESRPVFSQDTSEPCRRSEELPDKRPTSSQGTVEAYRTNTKFPDEHMTRPRRNTENHRAGTEASDLTSNLSKNASTESRPSTIVSTGNEYSQTSQNSSTDPFNTTSFAAYHAIAMHRSSHRTTHHRRKDQKAGRQKSPASRHQSPSGRHQSPSGRHPPPSNRYENTITEQEATSNRHEQISRQQKAPAFVTKGHSPVVNNSGVRINSNSVKGHRNTEGSRRHAELDAGLESEALRTSSDQTNFDQLRRNSDEVRRTSERIRSDSENNQTAPLSIRVDLTRSREELAFSENEITDGKQDKGKNRDGYAESHLMESQTAVKRKYTCLNCRSEFYHESSLVDHVCDIYSEILYSCLVCKKDFEGHDILEKHMRSHWKQVVYYTCTLCGERLRSEESLKKHNLKHLEDSRAEQAEFDGDEDGYRRITSGKTQDDPPKHFVTPPGSAKSVTSPVICSVSGNIVTKATTLERGRGERGDNNKNTEARRNAEPTNHNASCDDIIARPSHDAYMPYYKARKQASGYLNVLHEGPTMVVSAMHAAMETNGRYHISNGLLYQPTVTPRGYTTGHY